MVRGRLFQVERVERPSNRGTSVSQGSEEKHRCCVGNGEPLHGRTVAGGGAKYGWVRFREGLVCCAEGQKVCTAALPFVEADRLLNLAGLFLQLYLMIFYG